MTTDQIEVLDQPTRDTQVPRLMTSPYPPRRPSECTVPLTEDTRDGDSRG